MHPSSYYSIIHGGHDMETTKSSLDMRSDMESVAGTYVQWNSTQPARGNTTIGDACMGLENNMLSEFSQMEKVMNQMTSPTCGR